MRTNNLFNKICFALLLLWMQPAEAQLMVESIGFGIQAGSMGIGAHLRAGLNPRANLKIFSNHWKYTRSYNINGLTEASQENTLIKLGAVGMLYEWQALPNVQWLRLNGGLQYQWNKLTESRSYQLVRDGELMDIGNLTLEVSTQPIVPFLSLGIGNYQGPSNWKIAGELGVYYHGKPRVNFTGTGMIAPTAEQDDIIARNLNAWRYFPLMNLSVTYQIK